MLWFACGLVWSFVCCCLVTTSLWACSIKGHRIDRTLQLQPEADIISSISRSSFLCGFPRKLKPTCFWGPTSNLICLSLKPNQIVNRNMTLRVSNTRGPCDLPSTLAISETKGPSLRRDPVRYHFSKKKETRKQNQATSPSLFLLPIPSAHFPPNPLWQLRTSGCSAAFANPIISPKHQIDRKFQRCRARNSPRIPGILNDFCFEIKWTKFPQVPHFQLLICKCLNWKTKQFG